MSGETQGSKTNSKTFIARFSSQGILDTTFGLAGIAITEQNGTIGQRLSTVGDKLIVGLAVNFLGVNNEADFGLQRYNLSATPTQESDFDGDAFTDSAVFRP